MTRVGKYKKYEEDPAFADKKINTDGIVFPMAIKQFKKLEKQNPNLAINVIAIGEKKGDFIFEYMTKKTKVDPTIVPITLGRITRKTVSAKGVEIVESHYVWVKNISALIDSKSHASSRICYICLNRFTTDQALDRHYEDCKNHLPGHVVMPESEKD